MNKQQLLSAIQNLLIEKDYHPISKKDINAVITAYLDVLLQQLEKQGEVRISKLGTFLYRKRNVRSKLTKMELVEIKRLIFRPSTTLRKGGN